MPWLAPLLTAFWFSTINANSICGTGPPALPAISLGSFDQSIDSLSQILRAIAWPNICRCKNGTPPPIPYPLPAAAQPTSWPALPTFSCNDQDVCTTLTTMQQQLAFVAKSISPILELTQLQQRYRLPFAVIDGAAHVGATDSSSFLISRLIGMRVDVTTIPTGTKILPGNPPYYWDLGWMAIANADGFTEEKRITRAEQTWFADTMPQALVFEYHLSAGVTATFTEIEAEP